MPRRIGPFLLTERLGQGGMGEVWRADHPPSGLSVALKILTQTSARQEEFRLAFDNEVRAVARLDHPGITAIYERGVIEDETTGFTAGSPWLAMELGTGGTLMALRGKLKWPELKQALLAILDALGHAHARGVIHRDIKPGNVLVGADMDELLLSDFGLASVRPRLAGEVQEGPLSALSSAGTPAYMAPEQVRGEWRDFGPWTDLYAVGALGWALATGRPPIVRDDAVSTMRAQVTDPIPPLPAWSAAPKAFRAWVVSMMGKRPEFRPASAAQAAQALRQVDDAPAASVGWRRDDLSVRPRWLEGAGLGLVGLRQTPIVDREHERDELWQALESAARGKSQVVVLSGPSGTGKSRLSEWLGERGHEVRGATLLQAVHSPSPGPRDGLPGMLCRALGCEGLDSQALFGRLREQVAREPAAVPGEASVLAELVSPQPERPRVRFGSPAERHLAIRRVLQRLAGRGPVVMVLDDVQWSTDAIHFAGSLLGSGLPVVAVLTVQDEALAERDEEQRALMGLAAREGCSTLALGPLPPSFRTALVEELLGLSGDLAQQVANRSAGNPLFAVRLVEDWVERGLLAARSDGFQLVEGAREELPADLLGVWSALLDRLFEHLPAHDQAAVELAAVLGHNVVQGEWHRACVVARALPSPSLLDILVGRQLALPRTGGFAFAHGMLREALIERAGAAGRLRAHHRAVASVLADDPGARGRVGLHLLEANRPEEALVPLLTAAGQARNAGDLDHCRELIRARERALDAADVPASDRRRSEGLVLLCRAETSSGEVGRERAAASALLDMATEQCWPDLQCVALQTLSAAARRAGENGDARAYATDALTLARTEGDPFLAAACLWELGLLATNLGELDHAVEHLSEALVMAERSGDEIAIAGMRLSLGYARLHQGDDVAAEAHITLAAATYAALGVRVAEANCHNARGEIHRARGELALAAQAYRRAADGHAGSAQSHVCWLNVGIVLSQSGDHDKARSIFERQLSGLERIGWRSMLGATHALILAGAAAAEDWEAWDHHLARAEQELSESGFVDRDVRDAARRAADLARGKGEEARARRAEAIAMWQESELA